MTNDETEFEMVCLLCGITWNVDFYSKKKAIEFESDIGYYHRRRFNANTYKICNASKLMFAVLTENNKFVCSIGKGDKL